MQFSQPLQLPIIGWREWVTLPVLGISDVKAKIDTGARSSALHAFEIERIAWDDCPAVRFKVHPIQRNTAVTIVAEAELLEERPVRSSNGEIEVRPTIRTDVELGGQCWAIELTLTNRDAMGFRLLLGRQTIRDRFLIDAGRSFLQHQDCDCDATRTLSQQS